MLGILQAFGQSRLRSWQTDQSLGDSRKGASENPQFLGIGRSAAPTNATSGQSKPMELFFPLLLSFSSWSSIASKVAMLATSLVLTVLAVTGAAAAQSQRDEDLPRV